MNNIELIEYTRFLQNKNKVLNDKQEQLGNDFSKLKNEIINHQENCHHIAFSFGGTEYLEGLTKCLLCGCELSNSKYTQLKNLGLIVDANSYRNKKIIKPNYGIYNSDFYDLYESLFNCFQDRLLELCNKYPILGKRINILCDKKLVAMLNQMIINDKEGSLLQSPNEQLFNKDTSTIQKNSRNGRKEIKGLTYHKQG